MPGLSFFERMQGHVTDRWGRDRAVDFAIKAEASHLRTFLRTGEAKCSGVVHAEPWAREAVVDGTIRIRPFVGRSIEYDLTFADAHGKGFRLYGRKDLTMRAPLGSATVMAVALEADGEPVGRGTMRFDSNDLVQFLAKWWPDTTIQRVETSSGEAVDRELLFAFADAVIEPGQAVPAVDDLTVDGTEAVLSKMAAPAVTAFGGALQALDALAVARTGRRFASLPRERRVALIEALDAAPTSGLVQVAAMPVRAAHFERRDYLAKIGAPTYEREVREPDPEWMSRLTAPEDLPEDSAIECDVVVVGTGAGGGAIAARLAEQGLAVALLEEGRHHGRKDFAGSPLQRMHTLWRDAGLTFTVGNPPVSVPLGRMVGGTTAINSGTCFRAPERVFADWRRDLGLSDEFSPEGMDRHYAAVEEELGVAPAPAKHLGRIAQVVSKGAEEMGLAHAPLPRNAPGCDGQGVCVLGCPSDAKRSSNVSWVPRAIRAGAALFTGLKVRRLHVRGRKVVAVEARGTDRHGAPRRLVVRARAVVLSCGSLVTPWLLKENGFDLPMLGRNLSLHPEIGMWVRFDEPCAPWDAIPQGYGVHGLEPEGIKFEGYWVPPSLAGATVPLLGKELTRWMDLQGQVGQYGFMVKDDGSGSVGRSVDGRPLVRYDLTDATRAKLQRGAAVLTELLLRGGGREVLTGIRRVPAISTIAEARALATRDIPAFDYNLLGSHPLGTARIGTSPETAVCDPDHKLFGTDNLYVVDGGSVPTSLGVNPQMTIMALAMRASERLAARLA